MSNISSYKKLDTHGLRTLDIFYQAFNELLKERHYRYIKVQDITNKASLNRATFYNHFENKNDFIFYCTRVGFRRDVEAKFSSSEFSYNAQNLSILIHWILKYVAGVFNEWHIKWDELLFESATKIEFYYYLVDWMSTLQDQATDSHPIVDTYAMVLSSSIIGFAMTWCHNGCKEPIDEISERITAIFTNGLPCL